MKYLYLIFSIVGLITLKAQPIPEFEKKIWVSPQDRIYIHTSLPMYFNVSTVPDNSKPGVQLKSEATPQFTLPLYLDGDGKHTIRHTDPVNNKTMKVAKGKEAIFEIYADSKAPYTKLSYGKAMLNRKKGNLYANADIELILTAYDEIAGIENTYISLDSANFTLYTDTVKLEAEKEYIIKYFSVDHVGNVEKLKIAKVIVDKTKPITKLEITGNQSDNIIDGKTQLLLKSEDGSSGISKIYYSIDGANPKPFIAPISTAYISQGEHTLIYYATDLVNNTETQQTYTFYVDKTPPTILQEIIGKSFYANGKEFSSGRSQLKLTTFDNKAGVKEIKYSINKSEYVSYEKPVTLTNLGGSLVVKAYAVDKVGNRNDALEQAGRSSVPYIDLSGPQVSHNFTGPIFITDDTIYINNKTKIIIKAFDAEAGINRIEYTINKNEMKVYEYPFTINDEGVHIIQFSAIDNVENTNSGTVTVFVDTTGPAIFERYSTSPKSMHFQDTTNIVEYPDHVVLFLSATDIFAGFERLLYSINGSKEKPCMGSVEGFHKKVVNVINVKAYDKLGNKSEKQLKMGIRN